MKLKFIKYGLLSLLLCILLVSCDENEISINSNVSNNDYFSEETFLFEEGAENTSKLSLDAVNGEIILNGTNNRSTIVISGTKRVESESIEDAEEHLLKLEVHINSSNQEIMIQTDQPQDSQGRNYIVDYLISLPENLEVDVKSINGVVEINNINNIVYAKNVNGNIILDDITGDVDIELTNGTLDTEITLPLNAFINLYVLNGVISLEIPQETSAEFTADVAFGNISISNIELNDQVITSTTASGTLGNGEGSISLSAINGNINVSGF